MNEKIAYICEYCGSPYFNKADCKECEASHRKPVRIVKSDYRPEYGGGGGNYPGIITVEFDDGTTVDYRCRR